VRARSTIVAALTTSGATQLRRLRAEAPLLVRTTGGHPSGLLVQLVGGAAGPLGGDELSLEVVVEQGARLVVRSVAASVAQPGRATGSRSRLGVRAVVGAGGSLDWWPEPTVAAAGCSHEVRTSVEVDEAAALRWVDEVRLGRHGEVAGELRVVQRVTVAGAPLAVHEVHLGPAGASAGEHGPVRVAITGWEHGPPAAPPAACLDGGVRAARMPLGPSSTAWTGLGDDHEAVRGALARLGLER